MKFITHEEYKRKAPKDKGVAHCPFCFFDEDKTEELLRENTLRRIFSPMRPVGGVDRYKLHVLLVPKKHHKHIISLSADEVISKQEAELWIAKKFEHTPYFSFIKYAEESKTIQHVHYHYIVGELYHEYVADSILHFDTKHS